MAIVKSDQWEKTLQQKILSGGKVTTPFLELIKKMPRKS